MHAHWENNIKEVDSPFIGEWPSALSDISMISIVKNGHTQAMNTIGDLEHKWGGKFVGAACHLYKGSRGKRKGRLQQEKPARTNNVPLEEQTLHLLEQKSQFRDGRIAFLLGLEQQLGQTALGDIPVDKVLQHAADHQREYEEQQRVNSSKEVAKTRGHIVFAVVRNPVSRFLSALCQDLVLEKVGFTSSGFTAETNTSAIIDKALDRLQAARPNHWPFHQIPQISQILEALGRVTHLAVTLVSLEKALSSILDELGGDTRKQNRDRHTDSVYVNNPNPLVNKVCKLVPEQLGKTQVSRICDIYRADVRMMELAGLDVLECHQTVAES
eukprot:CAMPEP_0168809518 /NCGR_PEP_ID=MMETSP0726-20121227/3126_1 /TAXON_ID=265536 /ORGANISM="Amphiprora sp., Strain CCMP467" /LENGTH=327 /DNA_ID=CAMNT_0008861503 /DNA_START=98 /DNA_END=1081 /DNA_ORIENTATION=-